MHRAFAALTVAAACSSAPAPPAAPLSHHETSALLSYCIERETPCQTGAHTELVNGKLVTVIGGGLDCVGPRHVECTFAAGRHVVIPGEATDVVGLGGGSYRYLAWDGDRPTLVTVAHGQSTRVAGGAARTYGPFGPYGLTAQSLDGRIAATPEEDPGIDETISAIVVRDTTRNAELARIALRPPIQRKRAPHVLLSGDGKHVGLCTRVASGLALQLTDRTIQLPGTRCVAADADLAQVIVQLAIDDLAVVELASGRRTALAARQAVFAGRDGAVLVVYRTPYVRGQDPGTPVLVHEQLTTHERTPLGAVPFGVDEIRVAADGRSAIVFHEKTGDDPPRAMAVRFPDGRPYELAIPADTVDIAIVSD